VATILMIFLRINCKVEFLSNLATAHHSRKCYGNWRIDVTAHGSRAKWGIIA